MGKTNIIHPVSNRSGIVRARTILVIATLFCLSGCQTSRYMARTIVTTLNPFARTNERDSIVEKPAEDRIRPVSDSRVDANEPKELEARPCPDGESNNRAAVTCFESFLFASYDQPDDRTTFESIASLVRDTPDTAQSLGFRRAAA